MCFKPLYVTRIALHNSLHPALLQVMKTPPTSYFLKKAAGIKAGSQKPGHESSGVLSLKHIYEIAAIKQKDTPHVPLESMCKTVMGSCSAMGITVVAKAEEA
jgi:large subunit ribosomal protein L11